MKGKTYDMEKLAAAGVFDTTASARFYYNTQEYFDALTDFVKHYRQDLSNYTPAFVVNSDENRDEFLKECREVRANLTRLGMVALLEGLSVMEDAAIHRNLKEFSDGQVNFHANLRICRDVIKDATMRWRMTRH